MKRVVCVVGGALFGLWPAMASESAVDAAGTVASSSLFLSVDAKGRVCGLRTAAGAELVDGQAVTTLFNLEATSTNDFTVRQTFNAATARKVEVVRVAGGLDVVFSGFATNQPAERVTCRLRGAAGDRRLRFGLETQMRDGWALTRADYPMVQIRPKVGEKGEDDRFASGHDSNVVWENPSDPKFTRWFRAKFPTHAGTQFMTLYDDLAGFVFAAEDACGLSKEFAYNRGEKGYQFYLSSFSYEPGVASRPYEVTLVGLAGTAVTPLSWHDAADVYREWASRQKWCSTAIADRADLPAWMKDAPVMMMFKKPWFDRPELLHRWLREYWEKRFPGVPGLASLWGWEGRGEWLGTDYFPCHPSDEAFVAITKDLRAHGIHAYPWPSGYFWTITYDVRPDGTIGFDDRPRFEKVGKGHVVCDRDGKVHITKLGWIRGGDAVELCGGDPWTIPWVSETIVRGLARRGCDVVQGDQLNGGEFGNCWCRAHPHAPGTGLWKVRAMRAQLASAREAIAAEMPEGGVVTYEEANETLDDLSGVQLVRYGRKYPLAERANLFAYVNHGKIPLFAANPSRNFDVMAFSVTEGLMPRIIPELSDLGGLAIPTNFFASASEVRTTGTNRFHYGENANGADGVFRAGRKYRLSADFETIERGKNGRLSLDWGLYTSSLKSVGGSFILFPKPGTGVQRLSRDFTVGEGATTMFRVMLNASGDAHGKVSNITLEVVGEDGSVRPAYYEGDIRYEDFMRRWIALYRGRAREFLMNGRREKPPRLACARQERTDPAPGFPSVCVGAFATADGSRRALVFANATLRPQRVTWFDGRDQARDLAPLEIRFEPVPCGR